MNESVILKTYKGSDQQIEDQFRADAEALYPQGYRQDSTQLIEGKRGCGSLFLALFVGAILLLPFAVLFGFIAAFVLSALAMAASLFLFKPDDKLMVTYRRIDELHVSNLSSNYDAPDDSSSWEKVNSRSPKREMGLSDQYMQEDGARGNKGDSSYMPSDRDKGI